LFKGETEGETLAKILRDPVPPPTSIVPTLPRGFDGPLLKALNRDVTRRHTTARELALELERCCGIASPTEVGEWVEDVVGPVLIAREQQIALIESNSAGMTAPQGNYRNGSTIPEGESDSDMSLPSSRAIRAATGMGSPIDTLPMGSGPPISGEVVKGPLGSPQTPTAPMTPRHHAQAAARFGTDEGTGSKSRTGMLTGTMMMLPVDRKLPILASIAGIIVLFVVVVVIIGGKFSRDADAKTTNAGGAQTGSAAAVQSVSAPVVAVASAAATTIEIPDPAPTPTPTATTTTTTTTTATTDSTSTSTATGDTPPPTPPPTTHRPPTPPQHNNNVVRQPPPVKPSVTPTAVTPPPPKKDCNPNYTIDAQGRKKYKLECM
jgi:eukaryotic-like serine/threonine-protein kinase